MGYRALKFSAFLRAANDLAGDTVSVDKLITLVVEHHHGVGAITMRWLPNSENALDGVFLWLEEDRTSPYDEPFNDAVIFINDKHRQDDAMRRFVAAKELMHVFDEEVSQTRDATSFRLLLSEIGSSPLFEDGSLAYRADRIALWKAILALVPPRIRNPYKAAWANSDIKAHELGVRWEIPEQVAAAAMGDYYDKMLLRLT